MTPAGIAIRWTSDAHELDGAIAVRKEVFCREQGVPVEMELDGLDEQAEHLVALDSRTGTVVGTLRLLLAGGTAKIGRVAVERAWRRQGIAQGMLELGLERARERAATRARLAAQLDAVELYRRVGFAVESEPFEEAGIAHVWMGRELEQPDRAGSSAR